MGAAGHHALGLAGPAGDLGSAVHRLDPRAKLAGLCGVTVVAVTTPLSAWPVLVAALGVLGAVAVAAGVTPALLWRGGGVVLVPVLLVAAAVPFVRTGGAAHAVGPLTVHDAGLAVVAAVALKAAAGVGAAVLLAATTTAPAILRALEAARVPRLLVLVAALMHRYLFVLAGEVARMRAALAARGHRPRHALHAVPTGRVAAALFLRTYARGERVHLAMRARGFGGRLPWAAPLRFGAADAAFVALTAGALATLRLGLALVA